MRPGPRFTLRVGTLVRVCICSGLESSREGSILGFRRELSTGPFSRRRNRVALVRPQGGGFHDAFAMFTNRLLPIDHFTIDGPRGGMERA